MIADVVVIGAGFAGLSAAVRLADHGLQVVVLEEAPRLGGRATAFVDRESGERVDNGQHVLFGCYRETYAFLRRLATDHLAPLQSTLSVTMASDDGRTFELTCPEWPSPWHLIAGVLRWRAMSFGDRLSALGLRRWLADVRRRGPAAAARRVPAEETVADWLAMHRQSEALCRWLWNPLAVAALNQSPSVASAQPFARVLGELFGPGPEDASIGVPTVPLDELYAVPAAKAIGAAGGRVETRAPARIVGRDGGRWDVEAGAHRIQASSVVSAVPWHAFERLWPNGVEPSFVRVVQAAGAMNSSPIVTVNLWFDAPIRPGRFIGLVDGTMHWVFDKSEIFGEQAGHVSVVASGAGELARLGNREITERAVGDLHLALPAVRARTLLRSVVVREHRATFSLAPGQPARPPARTPIEGFYLAGDWTDTGLPGTIESAVVSGHAAAALVLADRQKRKQTPELQTH
jgi:squalene-associated FAD-dependent desaturase